MCRLLGVVGASAGRLADLLATELPAFTELSTDHCDGWGVAHWHGDELRVDKEPTSARTSVGFTDALGRITTDAALLHIRLANPGSPLVLANTHPFRSATVAFAHNGDFSPAGAIDELLAPPLLEAAVGTTDSERFFLLVRQLLQRTDPATALSSAAAAVRRRATRYSGLNCLLLTERSLYAYADHDPDSAVSRRRGPGFFPLNYLVEPGRVVIASTGWDQPTPPWNQLDQRQVLEVRRSDLRVSRHLARPGSPPVASRESARGIR
ncbi:class II glutamine amidotransferase [Micromonospora sp. NPDC023814]|uniref:class II glutamine amidotransferase n=1 Tax=Micromonospora sp. NPDC023814 TaxID=3154596 RepID=UPI0033D9E17B